MGSCIKIFIFRPYGFDYLGFLTNTRRCAMRSKTQWVFYRDLDWWPGPQKVQFGKNHLVPLGCRALPGSVNGFFNFFQGPMLLEFRMKDLVKSYVHGSNSNQMTKLLKLMKSRHFASKNWPISKYQSIFWLLTNFLLQLQEKFRNLKWEKLVLKSSVLKYRNR